MLNSILHKFGIHISRISNPGKIPWLLKVVDSSNSTLSFIAPTLIDRLSLTSFVQVGANDGEHGDPFETCAKNSELRGILVEPQPRACSKLRKKYIHNPNIIIEDSAIGNANGFLTLYQLDDDNHNPIAGHQYDLVTSSNQTHLNKMRKQMGVDMPIKKLQVPSLTWDALLQKHGFNNPDIVIVDIEGMDDQIVNQINLRDKAPTLIQFEHMHIPSDRLEACTERLMKSGYNFVASEYDVICIHKRAWMPR